MTNYYFILIPFLFIINKLTSFIVKIIPYNSKVINYLRTTTNPFIYKTLINKENPLIVRKELPFHKNFFNLEFKKRLIQWPFKFYTFMYFNGLCFKHDFNIKSDILHTALKLPNQSCIIDCGAHIGDGTIPIAHALKYLNREDIIVYAIDCSDYKCKFIETIAKINNLDNVKVINGGLSDINDYCSVSFPTGNSYGTGGSICVKSDKNKSDCKFYTLDTLVENNIIKEKIGILHLDIEGNEFNALKGGETILKQHKPYLSLENFEPCKNNLSILPKDYNYKIKIGLNSIYTT